MSTDRQKALRRCAAFVVEVLPFLNGKEDAPDGTNSTAQKLCTETTCALLGVSRRFLYARKKSSLSKEAAEDELCSIVDYAGTRMRHYRRLGQRQGYPPVEQLNSYPCGCNEPFLAGLKVAYMEAEFTAFARISQQQNPSRRENRYLLEVMYCPFLNAPTKVCNKAISALYAASPSHINDVHLSLEAMCSDESSSYRPDFDGAMPGYVRHRNHPIRQYSAEVRKRIEAHLDIVLRADPAGSMGFTLYRVYSPEINTRENFCRTLREMLNFDDEMDLSGPGVEGMVQEYMKDEKKRNPTDSTFLRMISKYLEDRKSRISFDQNDHNACPNCKTLHYAVLQFSHEPSSWTGSNTSHTM